MQKIFLVLAFVISAVVANAAVEPLSSGHKCFLFPSGLVKCAGENNYGQPGVGDRFERLSDNPLRDLKVPFVKLSNKDVATKVVTGANHSCALLSTGQFKCWGRNHVGQLALAYGNDGDVGDEPGEMDNLSYSGSPRARVADISAIGNKTCVKYTSGYKTCWGR